MERIDTAAQVLTATGADGQERTLKHDRLVLAADSRLVIPDLPGLPEFAYDVDTYDGATRLADHMTALADGPATPGACTAVVVGAGLTGIETACELPDRLAAVLGTRPRVVLVDHNAHVGSDMGASARPVIEAALADLGVETRTGVGVTAVSEQGAMGPRRRWTTTTCR